jgi:curved DNA-binding protein CbpA
LAIRKLPPPPDYFALLDQPRRPWLDPEQLKAKHQQLTLALHPDISADEATKPEAANSSSFSAINEAYRVLSDPKQRLGHLLGLEGHSPSSSGSVPNELIELFARIGDFIRETDDLLKKIAGATSALAKSLLQPQMLDAQRQGSELLDQLQRLSNHALNELRRFDGLWDDQREEVIERLEDLYRNFAYLSRWTEQLRERQFRLSN